jgi:hypothetical protein
LNSKRLSKSVGRVSWVPSTVPSDTLRSQRPGLGRKNATTHLLDLRGVRDDRDQRVRALGRVRGRGGEARAVLGGEALGLLAGAVVDRQLEARLAQVARHWVAHDAQADEGHSVKPCHVRHLRVSRWRAVAA